MQTLSPIKRVLFFQKGNGLGKEGDIVVYYQIPYSNDYPGTYSLGTIHVTLAWNGIEGRQRNRILMKRIGLWERERGGEKWTESET